MEKEIEREVLEVESREKKKRKKKRRGWDIWVYVCGAEKTREKKKRKHMDERMEIIPQYCYNIFTINFK